MYIPHHPSLKTGLGQQLTSDKQDRLVLSRTNAYGLIHSAHTTHPLPSPRDPDYDVDIGQARLTCTHTNIQSAISLLWLQIHPAYFLFPNHSTLKYTSTHPVNTANSLRLTTTQLPDEYCIKYVQPLFYNTSLNQLIPKLLNPTSYSLDLTHVPSTKWS